MSRLDRHVAFVQNKLALARFVYAVAWALLIYAGVVWAAIIVDRLAHVRPIHAEIWFWAGLGVAVLAATIYAIIKRPDAKAAAIAIDSRLGLKEKFSTALYVRPLSDPFAKAAVLDAERTADNVSLHKRFPLEFPMPAIGTAAVVLAALLTFLWLPSMDLFGREQARKEQARIEQQQNDAKKVVQQALARVNATPRGVADEETIKRAQADLKNLLNQPVRDPEAAKRSAAKALQDVGESIKHQMANSQRFADAQADAKAFKNVMPSEDDKGPVADAQRSIAKGDFSKAIEELEKTVENFDKMSDDQKKQQADQMKKMAEQLKQMASDPKAQQQMQQQLQQLGMNQQQAAQIQQQMQAAAQGDQKAAQELQKQAQQMMQQMNNGQGPNPQQQQQINQMMKQLQAQANAQQQAQQMSQAASQLAQAMQQQASQQQQSQQGQAGQQGKQGQQSQQSSQQMASAKSQMQQQLQAMQAMQNDAQQVAAAQQAAQQAAQGAAGQCQPGQGNGQPGQMGQGQQQWAGNNPNWQAGANKAGNPKPNQGMGGAGIGAGPRDYKEEAPYAVKPEMSRSDDIESGKILASTLVKAKSEKGVSKVGLQEVVAKGQKEATDEVEQERISRPAQQAVKEYFRSIEVEAPSDTGAATTQPAQ